MRRKRIFKGKWGFVAGLAFLLIFSGSLEAENLITDGSFEKGISGWGGFKLDGKKASSEDATWEIDEKDFHKGKKSLKVTNKKEGDYITTIVGSSSFKLQGETPYHLRMAYRTKSAKGIHKGTLAIWLRVAVVSGDGKPLVKNFTGFNAPPSETWTVMEKKDEAYVTKKEVKEARITIFFYGKGEFWIDDLYMEAETVSEEEKVTMGEKTLSVTINAEINVPLSNWRVFGTQVVVIEAESNKPEILKIKFSRRHNVKWPEARKALTLDLSKYNRITFRFKTSQKIKKGSLILYCPGVRSIIALASILGQREIPANEWIEMKWDFKKNPGWVTGNTNKFDYSHVNAVGVVFDNSHIPVDRDLYFEISDLKITQNPEATSFSSQLTKFLRNRKPGVVKGKTIILWPSVTTEPFNRFNMKYVCENIEVLKSFPVDGLVVELLPAPFRDQIFSPDPISEEKIQEAVAMCKRTDWGHLKNNFIRIDIVATILDNKGNQIPKDWFDDKMWENIIKKIRIVARACKEIQFNILFDNEAYSEEPYDYFNKYRNTGRSFSEYEQQVKKRGKQVVEAIAEEYSGTKILTLFGNWVLELSPEQDRYALLPAFIDGMLSAKGNVAVIDGYEKGYDCRVEEDYAKGRFQIKELDKELSSAPQIYCDKLKVSFAVWLRTSKFTVQEFVECVRGALQNTDKYVWIYCAGNDYQDKKFQSYIKALKQIER